jgi:hypothetical protein
LNLTIDQSIPGPLYVYYGLDNFYQNHRRFVKSRDDNQLIGDAVTASSISGDCAPYRLSEGEPIAPCGAIANSLFNDTFTINTPSSGPVSVSRKGIAWDTDHDVKFQNPASFAGLAKPFSWNVSVDELDPSDSNNNGYRNEAFIVWMRTAAFPTFRKLYGIISSGLPMGSYSVQVDYNYPVSAFGGQKHFILSTTNWLGGKNPFLGITYIVVGVLSLITGIVLIYLNRTLKPKTKK